MSKHPGKLILILIVVIVMSGCRTSEEVTQTQPTKPSSLLATMLDTSKVFSSNLTGFALYDPAGDSMIYSQNADRYFTPASNTKLFTFYTGLKLLPDSLRALEYVVRGDSLIFWGTGDPSFLHSEFGNGDVYEFLKSSEENLYYSDSNFEDDHLGPGWSWADYNSYYSTEISPLPMYGNTVQFKMQEIDIRQIMTADSVQSISPGFFRSYMNQKAKKEKDDPILYREINGNNFDYKPEADTAVYTVAKPFHYTPELITSMLSDTLEKSVEYIQMEKPEATKTLYSIDADTTYKRMLQPSDNFIAEQLLLVAASELGEPLNSEIVIGKMKSEHLSFLSDEPQWVDGSGLSRYNMFTPRSIIELLAEIDDEFKTDEALFHLLPAGGESGTISNWYDVRDGGPAYVFAKTGTLSNNHCLSGYLITEDGKKLIFSFMNNHYVTSSSVVKEEMEKVLWYIHKTF